MLALYHLCSGVSPAELPGIEEILSKAETDQPKRVRRAVLVGTALSPAQPQTKEDGTVVQTLWGDMAWQLLRSDGYAMVAEADQKGVSPGSNVLAKLLREAQPCLILIDEWVAFVRQLYGKTDMPSGSFDANMTFAQSLSEALGRAPQAMLVAALPVSEIEVGGSAGQAALDRLRDVVGRKDSPWRPASADEGFEIVRRRLFQPITDSKLHRARDAVVQSFWEAYERNRADFPAECREPSYKERLQLAPI